MKSSLSIGIVLVLISAGASAQNKSYKVKSSTTEKAPKSTVAVPEKMSGTGNSAAKNLQSIERESAKSVAPSTAKKTGTASTVKPIKEESNPPINFTGKSQAKQGGMINQGPNPYKGRLKEKGSQQQ
jgi:hypothetical protein